MQQYIAQYGHQFQLFIFISLFVVIWNIENIYGRLINYKKWRHAFINAHFILTSIPGQLLLGFALIKTIDLTSQRQFGLLYLLPSDTSPVFKFIVSFVLLDLGEYAYHVIMHKVKMLWMIHVVHHSDKIVDVSTTLREHPAENMVRLSFTLVWVFVSGTAFWMLMLRQVIQAVVTVFAHMNYRLPDKLDRVIGLLFITPNFHQVHHHYKQPYTDCNYGDVLSIWDRIFGTFRRLPSENLVFGVDTYMAEAETTNFISLILAPFQKHRNKKKDEDSHSRTV
ncbi:MAG: sterol desaturase family protein [Bacteroidetes bacterium]|nr:sterol desaturase family protein [Bacteroidota bacterium]